jgi:hypothetical protein
MQAGFFENLYTGTLKESSNNITNAVNEVLLRYINKKKSQIWSQSAGLQLPMEGTKFGYS